MPPAESRVKMNGFAAPDTAAVICSAAIKRGFAAPSPGFPAHNFIFSESNLRKILDSTLIIIYEASDENVNEKTIKIKKRHKAMLLCRFFCFWL